MADTIEIFTLKIDMDEAVKSTAELTNETARLKRIMDATARSTEASTEEQVASKAAYDASNKTLKQNQRELANLTALRGKEIKTVEQGRNALSVLNKEWAKQASLYGTNSKEANKLADQTLELRNRLKELEAGVGDNTRNVGNYTESFTEALNSNNLFTRSMQNLTQAMKIGAPVVNAVKKEASAAADQFRNAAAGTEAMSKAQRAGAIATNIGTAALKIFKIALAATGIGLLIIALGSLIAFFSKTQKGIDFVSKAMAGLGAAFDVVTDRLSSFGEAITNLFSGGTFAAFFSEATDAASGFGDELEREVRLAIQLEEATQRLDDAEIALIGTQEARRLKAKELELAAKDELKTADERALLLKQAQELQASISEDEIVIARERARISQERIDQGKSTRDQLRENAQIQAEVTRLETAAVEKQITLESEKQSLQKRSRDEANVEQAKRDADLAKDIARKEKEVEAERKKLEELRKAQDEHEEIELDKLQDFEARKKELQDLIRLQNAADDEERALISAELQLEKDILEIERLTISEEQKTELLTLLETQRGEVLQKIKDDFAKAAAIAGLKVDKDVLAADKRHADARANVASALTGILKGFLGESLGAKLAAIAIDAAIASGLVAITSAKAQATNLANAATVGPPPVTAAMMVAAGAQNAIIAANSSAQIAKILGGAALQGLGTTASSLFNDGGMLNGRSHSQGGIPFAIGGRVGFEAEGGEAIINKRSMRDPYLRNLASRINQVGGGVAFADGGLTSRSLEGTGLNRNLIPDIFDYDLFAEKMSEANEALPSPIVIVEDINTGQNNLAEVEQGANV